MQRQAPETTPLGEGQADNTVQQLPKTDLRAARTQYAWLSKA